MLQKKTSQLLLVAYSNAHETPASTGLSKRGRLWTVSVRLTIMEHLLSGESISIAHSHAFVIIPRFTSLIMEFSSPVRNQITR